MHDWSGNRFFCLFSPSLHTNYEVQDSSWSSLFGSGGEEEWREEEKPALLTCVFASLGSAKTRCRDLASAAPVHVALPTSRSHRRRAKSSERLSSCARGSRGAAFLPRQPLVPALQESPFSAGITWARGCALPSRPPRWLRLLEKSTGCCSAVRKIECNSGGDKQLVYKCWRRETCKWVILCVGADGCI